MTYTGYNGPDEICKAMLTALHGVTTRYSELESHLAAASGDRTKAVAQFINSSDDPQAVKFREAMKKAQEGLRALAEKKVVSVELSETEQEQIKTELEGLKSKIRSGHQAISGAVDSLGTDPEGVKEALKEIGDPTRSGRGRKPGSTGSGLARPSVLVTVNGGKFDNKEFDSFSKVAMALEGVEVKDLQEAYARAAGVDPKDLKSVKEATAFEFQVNGNGPTYLLTTQPKSRQKPGPKPTDEKAESASEEAA